MPLFDIPQDWSPEQAITVCDFLEQLRDTIMVQYYEDIREYFQPQSLDEDPGDDPGDSPTVVPFDDEILF